MHLHGCLCRPRTVCVIAIKMWSEVPLAAQLSSESEYGWARRIKDSFPHSRDRRWINDNSYPLLLSSEDLVIEYGTWIQF
jgi:hypothetical protein